MKRFSLCSTDYTRDYTNRKRYRATRAPGTTVQRARAHILIHRHTEHEKVRRNFDPKGGHGEVIFLDSHSSLYPHHLILN